MPIFMTTGVYRVPAWKFFLLDGVAALVSVPLWIYVGYLFGSNLEVLEEKIRQFQFGIYATLGVLVLGFIAYVLIKKRIATRIA